MADRSFSINPQVWLQQQIAACVVPGAALAVARPGNPDIVAAAGHLRLDRPEIVRPSTLFQIGSVTKTMTASLAMILVDRGVLQLDTPIARYLHKLKPKAMPDWDHLTMRHLLTHRSGLDGDFSGSAEISTSADLRAYVMQLAEQHALHPVGSGFSYCNAGFVLAAYVLEVLTGSTWQQLIEEEVFSPLELKHAQAWPPEHVSPDAAWGHIASAENGLKPQERAFLVPASLAAAGSRTIMSATDLLRFVTMHLAQGQAPKGSSMLSKRSIDEMQNAQVYLPRYAPANASAWGIGWCLYDWNGRTLIGHDGDTVGQFSFVRADPASGTALVLLTNGGDALALADKVFDAVLGPSGKPIPEPAGLTRGNLSAYTGTYRRAGRRYTVALNGINQLTVQLLMDEQEGPHPPMLFSLEAIEPHVFVGRSSSSQRPVYFSFDHFDQRGRAGSVFSGYRLAIRDQ